MLTLRSGDQRGRGDHGWLDSRHSFSFADYHDPAHMGYSDLRVINEDRVAPGAGFPTHGHRDMEILSYVLAGALEHRDSLGNGSVIRPGDVQRMSAGTGVRHSEFNASKTEPVHFLQIWILPERPGLEPGYEQKHFGPDQLDGRLCLLAARDGRNGAVRIHQDCSVYGARLDGAASVRHRLASGRRGYLHLARGALKVNGVALNAGDGARIENEAEVVLSDAAHAELLLFDLA